MAALRRFFLTFDLSAVISELFGARYVKFDTAVDHKHIYGRYVKFDTAVDHKHVYCRYVKFLKGSSS